MSEEAEDDWNWMIQSMKKYAHLHMYELSHPTSVLEWMDQNTIFVADSSSSNGRYEILLLSLPQKLTNPADDQVRLSKDRDFKMVSGGFHQQPVHAVAMVSDKLLVTSSPSDTDEISLWEIKEDEDVITQLKTHQGQRSGRSNAPFVAANPRRDAQVASGSFLENLIVVNLETGKNVWSYGVEGKLSQPLSSIDYTDDCSLLLCSASNGRLHIIDTRSPSSSSFSTQPASSSIELSSPSVSLKPASWSCSVNFSSRHRRGVTSVKDGSRRLAAALSPNGLLKIYDMRDVTKTVCSFRVLAEGSGNFSCVRWSLNQDNLISVSGWDNCVRIYDISSIEKEGCSLKLSEPIFVHDGHTSGSGSKVWLTTHICHEECPHIVLSAGSDGSLHAWEWMVT